MKKRSRSTGSRTRSERTGSMTEQKHVVVLDDRQKRAIERMIEGAMFTTEQLKELFQGPLDESFPFPPKDVEVTTDPDLPDDRKVFAALSIVPAVGMEGEDEELNRNRLAMAVALQEATHHFLDPMKSIGGMNIRDFLQDPKSRRKMRVGAEGTKAGVGMKVQGLIDSVLVSDFVNGKRDDLLTIFIVEDDDNRRGPTDDGEQ